VSDRAWGTVREDYSQNGDAWSYFPFDQAASKAYRWGEDGIAGWCDRYQILVFAPAFWNGKDSILKERLFGLSSNEGNHGEDVKEQYYHVDGTFFDDSNIYFNSTGVQTVLITGLGTPITKLLESVTGGLFWTRNSKKYGESNFNLLPGSLPTGDYILKSRFYNLIPEPTLAQIGFTNTLFTACCPAGDAACAMPW
jgi:hypothetical protein